MYIKFTFRECSPIICLTDSTNISPPGYSYGSPQVVDDLPENTPANTVITTADSEANSYYIDCGDLDQSDVNHAVWMYNGENNGGNWNLNSIELPEKEVIPFIKTMKQALIQARREREAAKEMPAVLSQTQSYCSNRNLLFAAGVTGAVLLGVAAGVAIKRHFSSN